LVVVATFVVTVLCGSTMVFGIHAFIAAYLINAWFLVAISVPLREGTVKMTGGFGGRAP
jgi:hypothetical protein